MFDHLVAWGVAIGSIGAAVLVTLGFVTSDLRAKRSLRKMSATPIAELRSGQRVKLVGTIRASSTLVSPNRKAACVYYHAWHEELQRGAKGGGGWVAVGEEQDGCDFTLVDDSGEARIAVEGIEGVLTAGSYLEIEGASRGTRGREAIVTAGERVAVIGTVTFEPGQSGADYRDGPPYAVIKSDGRTPLIVSNDPEIVTATRRSPVEQA